MNVGTCVLTPDAPIFARYERWRSCVLFPLGVCACLLQQSLVAYPSDVVRFEIASQPIIEALDQYSAVTGREIFYDGALAAGRRSNPVQGLLAPDAALRELLVGTGLIAKATGKTSFTLKVAALTRIPGLAVESYFAQVRITVSRALCAHAETRPSDQDRLVRIWVAPGGSVERAQLVSLSDKQAPARDVDQTHLLGLPVGPPPAGMPQPLVMAILAGAPSACSEVATRVH
jgi:hypothetical protein